MISNNKIKEIIEQMSEKGFAISVRDISYILLCRNYEDDIVAYKSLFGDGSETEISYYKQSKPIVELSKLMAESLGWNSKEDITFEENKAEIIRLIQDAKDKEARGELDAKQSLDLQTKLRVALNDKFGAKDNNTEQIVQVFQKYDGEVCPHCHREISRNPITKEEAIKLYDLVEKR